MINISDFLGKFKKFDQDKSQKEGNVVEIIKKTTGIVLKKENFDIRDGTLFIKGSPSLKQEIYLKKENLLSLLKTEGVSRIL